MIKIGGVNIDVSHPRAFSERMEDYSLNMKYEYIFNEEFRGEDEVEWFVKRFGLAGRASDIGEMADKVDIGFVQACNWEKHLDHAMPFIEKGKPVFIDKPMAGSVKDIKKIRELVNGGAKIYGSSSIRYVKEIRDFLSKPLDVRGETVAIFGTSGVNEFDYSIHSVEALSQIAGAKAVSGKYIGKANGEGGDVCEMFTVEYENGVRGTYYSYIGKWRPFHITVMTTKGVFSFAIDASMAYIELLRNIGKAFEGKKNDFVDVDTILNCCEVMLCAKKSRDEKNGADVKITELCEDDKFDGYAFEREYAANAKVIYKDKKWGMSHLVGTATFGYIRR